MNLEMMIRNFIEQVYMEDEDSQIMAQEICDMFRAWYKETYGFDAVNGITKKQIYTVLKGFPEYPYVRCHMGYCLRGLGYRGNYIVAEPDPAPVPLTLNILPAPMSPIPQIQPPISILEKHTISPRPIGLIIPRALKINKKE